MDTDEKLKQADGIFRAKVPSKLGRDGMFRMLKDARINAIQTRRAELTRLRRPRDEAQANAKEK